MKADLWAKVMVLAAVVTTLAGCNKDDVDNNESIPYAPVNEQINLTNIAYAPLHNDNGTVAIPGGVRGILVVRQNASQYFAFERNCTFRVYDSCAIITTAPSLLHLQDTCCSSTFNFDGSVRTGPASRALLRYNTALNGNLLTITN